MTITLYHHPMSRAADVVWFLEEVEQPYELAFVDLKKQEQRGESHRARNRMQKVPVLVDDGPPIAERSAIGLYLADRYAPGRLAPALDDPARGAFLRWCFYATAVVEPGCMAKAAGWDYGPGQAGWGRYEDMVDTLEEGIGAGSWLLGERFTIADCILGGTLRWMLMFKMIVARDAFTAYLERIDQRPAFQRSRAVNERVIEERGLRA